MYSQTTRIVRSKFCNLYNQKWVQLCNRSSIVNHLAIFLKLMPPEFHCRHFGVAFTGDRFFLGEGRGGVWVGFFLGGEGGSMGRFDFKFDTVTTFCFQPS